MGERGRGREEGDECVDGRMDRGRAGTFSTIVYSGSVYRRDNLGNGVEFIGVSKVSGISGAMVLLVTDYSPCVVLRFEAVLPGFRPDLQEMHWFTVYQSHSGIRR